MSGNVPVPVILSGGMGELDHMVSALKQGKADAVAIAHMLHYGLTTIDDLRACLRENGIATR